ncbi:MAG: multidrug efflux system transrane protein [Verrucomicrobiaceae bacterium]|nr:multidrug efflux system transrane protein [Verrucomicrobiaceae bacterium]
MQTNNAPDRDKRALRPRLLNRRFSIALAIVVGVSAAYFLWHKFAGKRESLDDYQIASVQRGDIEDLVTATGTLQPRDYVDIGAQVSGQLKKIHVDVGSVVTAGSLLAEIDPTLYLANVDARRALLRNQQATLLDRDAQLALAELQYTRQKNLMEGDATTTESVQAAEATLRSAKAQLQALQAQIEQTQSTLQADEANLSYAKIYAPMAGVVVSITARQGQTLNANQQAPIILRIADLSTMTVQTQVSEADVSRLSPNMEAYFTTLGNRGKRFYGKLYKVEPTPTVTNNVVLYNALFDVLNTERRLLPQMTAQVFFVAASAQDALFIPAAAIAKSNGAGERSANGKTSTGTKTEIAADKKAADKNAAPDSAERRQRFANMTEEERQAMRARRAQREQNGEAPSRGEHQPPASADSTANAKKESVPNKDKEKETAKEKEKDATAATAQPQVWAGVAAQPRREPTEATVKVVNADSKIEERKIKVGMTNRVHVEVLAGLIEGDQIVIGRKPPPGAASATQTGQTRERTALQTPSVPGMGGPR